MMFSPGYPGSAPIRGLASVGGGEFIVTTSNGQVARYSPARNESEMLADGLDQLYGVAVSSSGAVLVAELGAGRVLSVGSTAAVVSGGGSGRSGQVEVLASGLRNPLGVAIGTDGACFVSESGAGRVVKLSGSRAETVLDDLHEPHGILVRDGLLYVVDAGAKTLIAFDLKSKNRRVIVSDLPVGSPPGVIPKPLHGLPPFSGPQGPFAGIAAGPDGTLYISADAEGSVLALRRGGARQSS
jgi:glucose/arabinose dehydrogenase